MLYKYIHFMVVLKMRTNCGATFVNLAVWANSASFHRSGSKKLLKPMRPIGKHYAYPRRELGQ